MGKPQDNEGRGRDADVGERAEWDKGDIDNDYSDDEEPDVEL